MSLKIRLARAGTKKRPVYHIVIADSRSPRDGRFIERLGYFNPLLPKDKTERLKLDLDKVKAWMAKGALPTDRVSRFLDEAGVMTAREAQQSREGDPAQGAQGAGRSSRQGRGRGEGRQPLPPRPPRAGDLTIAAALVAERICVARIGAAHGMRGEVRLNVVHRRPDGGHALRRAVERGRHTRLRDRDASVGQGRPDRAVQGRAPTAPPRSGCATSTCMCRATGCRRRRPTSSTTPT